MGSGDLLLREPGLWGGRTAPAGTAGRAAGHRGPAAGNLRPVRRPGQAEVGAEGQAGAMAGGCRGTGDLRGALVSSPGRL